MRLLRAACTLLALACIVVPLVAAEFGSLAAFSIPATPLESIDDGSAALLEADARGSQSPATTTTSAAATTAQEKLVPFTKKQEIDKPAKIERECPPAACPASFRCPHQGGACCSNGKTCCPPGFICLNTFPGRCVADTPGTPNRCTLQQCKANHKCHMRT